MCMTLDHELLSSSGPESLVEQLETRLASAKDELSKASLKLSVLVHTFRQSQLHITPNLTNAAGNACRKSNDC